MLNIKDSLIREHILCIFGETGFYSQFCLYTFYSWKFEMFPLLLICIYNTRILYWQEQFDP